MKLILVSRDGERRDWEEGEETQVRVLKRKMQSALFTEETDHLRLLCGGRELEDGAALRDALQGAREPVALHVVAVKCQKPSKRSSESSGESNKSLCSHLCIIQ